MNDMIHQLQKRAGAEFLTFGKGEHVVQIAEEYGAYEAEYAAIRQRVGIMHLPQRGLIELRGSDVKDFLHRLVTQNINTLHGGQSVRSFQLNEKGRIVADMWVHFGDASTWLEMDVFDVKSVHDILDKRLFTEDVTMADITDQRECFALHGPAALPLLQSVADDKGAVQGMADMPGTHHVVTVGGVPATMARRDECGVLGVRLFVPTDSAADIYRRLLDAAGFELDAPDPKADPQAAAEAAMRRRQSLRGRPIGWLAYNTARIEAGTPIFHIDFGPDSLPAETGQKLLNDAVSFTKGCYLGQEIVARMKSLGHPKRVLVGLQFEDERMPVAGTQVLEAEAAGAGGVGAVVGGVTSSTVSVLLGRQAIAFAVMKWSRHEPGTAVHVAVEGRLVGARVTDLRFLPLD